ncbi:Glyoxylate 1 [Cyphellophora attinorum]|uniref:Glyoxylate 1 n=1 Tax=Cyphellophora attinorum TaxID=1664694 RepID=A0A0N0NIF2_9EURO|nr:Glyoxylate 1 [Phialophora attinorum]KPI35369.1 Glyoxylate 1 [Phialophora attinorum]
MTQLNQGIQVSNTPSVVNDATADTAMLLLLAALRRAWIPQRSLRQGFWDANRPLGRDCRGMLLGILGMGGIGLAVARRAAGFGFRLQYHNRSPARNSDIDVLDLSPEQRPKFVSLEELFRASDAISIHLPLYPETTGFIGYEEIKKMKDGVVIVNTARGSILNEDALVEGLKSGKVWSAGLDVFENEPLVHEGLRQNENVVLFPHIGTATIDTRHRMEKLMLDNVHSALKLGRLLTPVPQ